MKRETKVSSEFLLLKSSENHFISLPAFYLIIWLMKAKKTFEKIAILKTQGLVSFCDVKTHFGKIPLKWCIFRHEKIKILCNIMLYLLIQLRFLHTKHLKRIVWISVLWKISMLLPKNYHKWSENDHFWNFNFHFFFFQNWKIQFSKQIVIYVIAFDLIKVQTC